ncbi:MAG: ORF6N domain-containing protein [Candidatus Delongbacteria bacterium]
MEKFEESLKQKIYSIRGFQVMLDRDLAELYGLETRALKQAVKRNKDKFPVDFMFCLSKKEISYMVSQNVIPSKQLLGGSIPFVFTEHGVAMLSAVLKSKIAVEISIKIINAFIEMRKFILSNAQVLQRLDNVEVEADRNNFKIRR